MTGAKPATVKPVPEERLTQTASLRLITAYHEATDALCAPDGPENPRGEAMTSAAWLAVLQKERNLLLVKAEPAGHPRRTSILTPREAG